jgi:DNA-directed RNA polymerase specialized sigma subunit
MSKNNHYLNNEDFEQCIIGYKADPKKYENELVEFIDILSYNIYKAYNFDVEYEDCRQECYIVVLKAVHNFNPEKSTAFNYFTTCILNSFRSYYSKDRKYYKNINKFFRVY